MHPRALQYLAAKRGRGEGGHVALEGRWAVEAAMAGGIELLAVFVCPAMTDHRLPGAIEVGEKTMRRLVDRDGPDGVAALARLNPRTMIDLPGNLGTIIRCADGAGAGGVIVTDRRIRLSSPVVVKASMGTLFSLPVVETSPDAAIAWLRANRFRLVAADPAAPTSYRDADYRGRVAVVVGSERHGLAPHWRDAADVRVSIPMLGRADSLNVGHAAALLLYEALRRDELNPP
jgi:TrmH family RNA methyltransferase